jgi:hypothetical protein
MYVTAHSQWRRGVMLRSAAAHWLGLRVRILLGARLSLVSVVCCQVRPLRLADPSSRSVVPCLCVCH